LLDRIDRSGAEVQSLPKAPPTFFKERSRRMTGSASGIIHVDGGSRGNPGPAGYGFVILRDGRPPVRGNGRLACATNNVAEYTGLIQALAKARELGLTEVLVRSDSELLVKQMTGQYRVKNEQLRELFLKAKELAEALGAVRYVHVYREQNAEADRLANLAMDGTLIGEDASAAAGEATAARPSTRAARRKADAADSAWAELRTRFTRLVGDPAVAEALLAEVQRLHFVPESHGPLR
jgi:ribonuclease HI